MANNKKRAYIYVDIDKYARFKKMLDIMGLTMTGFFDKTMDDVINSMEDIILKQDKDAFLEMINLNLDTMKEEIEELKK